MNIDINKYRDFYNEYNEKINLACQCINSNSCVRVSETLDATIQYLKNQINNLSDWDDSAKDTFTESLTICLSNLENIRNSVTTDWNKSETLYQDILTQLNELKTNTNLLSKKIKSEPVKSNYEVIKRDETGNIIARYYPGYRDAYDTWISECKLYNDMCSNLVSEIQTGLNKLNEINQTFVQSLEKIPGMLGITINRADNLVSYNFRNNAYQIIDVKGGYQQVLNRIGKQKPDKCLDYSYRYANNIFTNSSSAKKSLNPIGLTTSDPSEILQIAAQEILEGRPSVIEVNGKSKGGDTYSRHFVTIVGLKENADLSNLKQSDFLILDPAGADIKMLDTDMGDSLTKRFLLSGENATHRVNNTEYVISIYSDASRYTSSTCMESTF